MGEKGMGSRADDLSRLASDYERWGLAEEAEAVRALYREAVVDEMREQALTAARSALRPA